MAKLKSSKQSTGIRRIGIKELKDQASSIVDSVHRTGRPVLLTKNNRPLARIEPILTEDPLQDLVDEGVLKRGKKIDWMKLDLLGEPRSGASVVETLLKERESGW